jgi:hypothetical protein
MEQFPFAVDNSDASSPIVVAAATGAGGDDASSLVTASSQGSFVPTSEEDGGLHSSSQQHTDDGMDHMNHHDAVFANIEHNVALPVDIHQPTLSTPTEPSIFGATIVELPPPSQYPHPTHQAADSSAVSNPPVIVSGTSLQSGVDALKSAGSRVTSVLSNLGYNLGINAAIGGSTATATAATVRTSNTSSTPPITLSKQHYDPPLETTTTAAVNNTAISTNDETTIDFAYINVTDEDEVDIWLDDSHANAYRNSLEHQVTMNGTMSSMNNPDAVRRGNILAVLLSNDVSVPYESPEGGGETKTSTMVHQGDQLVQLTEQASAVSSQAIIARKYGNLQVALDRHSDAAKLYHQAALLICDTDGTYIF